MAQSTPIAVYSRLARAAVIRAATVDDFSSLRYLHTSAIRLLAAGHLTADEIEGFHRHVYSSDYGDVLLAARPKAAWLDGELVGSGCWSESRDAAGEAVLGLVFVRPPFAGCGFGRRLVGLLEGEARAAGCRSFTVDATANSVGFFTRLGYGPPLSASPHLDARLALPVCRMVKCLARPAHT